jgi:pimeloyl-ACP methyl ester carboxylesterase
MASGRRFRKWIALGVLAVLGYVLLARHDRPRGATGAWLARAGLTAQRADVNGHSLRYVRAGSGSPLVLIHGFASSVYTWSETLPALARRHDVVALDLPGFGGSDMPADLVWPELPRAVAGLMDRLGLPRATIVGHSLGGAVALWLAARSPERVERLVLIDSAGFNLDPASRPKLVGLAASPLGRLAGHLPLRRALLDVALRQVFHDDAHLTPERVEEYLAPLSRPGFLPAMRSLLRSRQEDAALFPALLGEVRAPALILWGSEDRWAPLEHAHRFHAGIAGSRLVVFEACGHIPQEERPRDTLRVLGEFLGGAAS